MIAWEALTPSEHKAVTDALFALQTDLLAQVNVDLEMGDKNRLIDAVFHISHESNNGIADLARRERELQEKTGVILP